MHSTSQVFGGPNSGDSGLTPAALIALSKHLPRQEYNEMVTVCRLLHLENGNTCLIHTMIQNNHPHLLKQFLLGIERVLQSAIAHL